MKRNKFSLSHQRIFSCNMGALIPMSLFEVLPGDTIRMSTSLLLRASALLSPVMHKVDVRIHHWFVPYRLIWEDFEDFITGGPDGLDASVYPTVTVNNPGLSTLEDYLGLPPTVASNRAVSALPFRAYQLIWNENYRDQDLHSAVTVSTASGADTTTSRVIQHCEWEKDYFTASRPWEQKGPSVTIESPVHGIGTFPLGNNFVTGASAQLRETGTGVTTFTPSFRTGTPTNEIIIEGAANDAGTFPNIRSVMGIDSLREGFAFQNYQENRARWGSRYTEYLRAAFGVKSSDARLQRPEYLGGGRNTIQFSEVLQTAPTTSGSAVGVANLKGHGINATRSNRFLRFMEEHGIVITLLSVRPKAIYFQGIERMWNRRTKEDFYQREFESLGQQTVLNREIYSGHTTPEGTFGFIDRYDEYRRQHSTVAGEFRTLLNFWHMAREFSSDPALNATFVSCVPTERVFAVNTQDVLYCQAHHSVQARRPLQRVARPGVLA